LIPLFGISQVSDTVKCYGVKQLQKIATKLVAGQECDTLLKISNEQVINRDSTITLKDIQAKGYIAESMLKESIISHHEIAISNLTADLKKTNRKLKWTKFGWVTTSLLMTVAVSYFAFQ